MSVQLRPVRELSYELALALTAERPDEALEHFRMALDWHDSSEPTDVEVWSAIGDILLRGDDPSGAFESYVAATASQVGSSAPAQKAMELLGHYPELATRHWEGEHRIAVAVEVVPEVSAATCHLLAQVRRGRGDLVGAAAALVRAWDSDDDARPDGIAAELVELWLNLGQVTDAARVLEVADGQVTPALVAEVRLAERRFEDAETIAGRLGPEGGYISVLAAIGRGKSPEPDPEPGNPEAAFAAVVARLVRKEYDQALEVLDSARWGSRTDRAGVAALRAQIVLEGAGHATKEGVPAFQAIDDARALLASMDGQGLLRHRWLRRQELVRAGDECFQYARAEASAALGDDVQTALALVEACTRSSTSYTQDAALDELRATLLLRLASDPETVAAAYERAATAASVVEDVGRAKRHAYEAMRRAPTVGRAVIMADQTWRYSFDEGAPLAERTAAVSAAITLFTGAFPGGDLPVDADPDPAYYGGLLHYRRAALALAADPRAATAADSCLAVPRVLAAALARPSSAWEASWASSVLSAVNLTVGSWLAASKAFELAQQKDEGLAIAAEAAMSAAADFAGDSASFERVAAAYLDTEAGKASQSWVTSVRYHLALLEGRIEDLDAFDGLEMLPTAENPFLQYDEAVAGVLSGRVDIASTWALVETLGDSATERSLKVEILRLTERVDDADALLDDADRLDQVDDLSIEVDRALNTLVRGDADAEQRVVATLRQLSAPAHVLGVLNVSLAMLRRTLPRLGATLDRLERVALDRLEELRTSEPSAVAEAELRLPGNAPQRDLTLRLLELLESFETLGPAELLAAASALETFEAEWDLRSVLAALGVTLRERAGEVLLGRVTESARAGAAADSDLRLAKEIPDWPESLAGHLQSSTEIHELRSLLGRSVVDPDLARRLDVLLAERLDQVMGLTLVVPEAQTWLSPTPIAVELDDALVPFVDPDQDSGGDFIDVRIPLFRERLAAERGVWISGIRLRGSGGSGAGLVVRVDDVAVYRCELDAAAHDVKADIFTAIERGVAPYLARFLGPDEVEKLVARWRDQDPTEVAVVVPDETALVRLAWVLQDAVTEGVAIADWRAVLSAITRAGGIGEPVAALATAVTQAVRSQQPPTAATFAIPQHVLAGLEGEGRTRPEAWQPVLTWMRDVAVAAGEPVAFVVDDETLRDDVAVLARSVSPEIVTYLSSEVDHGR
ncbi:FHIPEP family type III secretion protein [Cellulomonas sp. Leaf334]|uniref:FHIPEP family type III secretion protein n=1 Tax=Cellulomonas sp. Leaf334 TaxID=1736339 RepID=UPI0006F6087E|nr:FHIPEP family type III secretion protein [Cellulomonas sp. Leaf334]KQR10408.1 hypothetical protein ASF78_17115 [Cellulomonas sp. Leaf334]